MIPILYPKGATKADTEHGNGLGFLTDCTKCEVTEERNGVYEAVMQYPVTGELFSQITDGAIFKAAANDTSDPQLFRIYKASKPANGLITYYAEHISYELNGLPVNGLKINNFSAQAALAAALVKCPLPHDFTAYSDILTPNSVNIETPCNLRPLLGGIDGSILDVYGGEYEFDNYKINLWQHRGYDCGVVLRYGKNIIDLKQESNISNCYTHLYPYAKETITTEDGEQIEKIITLPEQVLQLIKPADVGHSKALLYDFTKAFESGEEITEEALRQQASAYIETAQLGSPQVNITLSFTALWKTAEYKDIAALEAVHLCDTVHVVFERLGIQASAKVIKTVYDSLTEKYKSIEIGSVKANFASTVKEITQNIESTAAEAATNDAVLSSRLTVEAGRITAEAARASEAEGQLSARVAQTAEAIISEVTRATETEAALASTIEQEADKIAILVNQEGKPNGAAIVAAINEGSSEVAISADKIDINGAVSANGTFNIDEDGYMTACGGTIAEFGINRYKEATATDFTVSNTYNADTSENTVTVTASKTFNGVVAVKVKYTWQSIIGTSSGSTTLTIEKGSTAASKTFKVGVFSNYEINSVEIVEVSSSLDHGYIASGKTTYNDHRDGVYVGTDGIGLGGGFYVTKDGKLYARAGTINSLIMDDSGISNKKTDNSIFEIDKNGYVNIGGLRVQDNASVNTGAQVNPKSFSSQGIVTRDIFWISVSADGKYNSGYYAEFQHPCILIKKSAAESSFIISGGILNDELQPVTILGHLHPMGASGCNLGSNEQTWDYIYSNHTLQTSDKKEKTEIKEISTEFAEKLIYGLKPSMYKYKTAKTPRPHYGFIAQEVETLLLKLGLNTEACALVCKSKPTEADSAKNKYSLNYTEIIAPLVKTVQALQDKVKALEAAQKSED